MTTPIKDIQKKVTVVIPVYNEEKSIVSLIESIRVQYPDILICLINDGSTDNSLGVIGDSPVKNIQLLNNSENRGLNYSLLKGISALQTPYFIIMDGDGQHPVKYIQNFLDIFGNQKDSKIVIAERENISYKEFGYRAILSRLGNKLCKTKILDKNIMDPLSGFFGGNTRFFQEKSKELYFHAHGYKILFKILSSLPSKDIKISQFGYLFETRKTGVSKINFKVYTIFLLSFRK